MVFHEHPMCPRMRFVVIVAICFGLFDAIFSADNVGVGYADLGDIIDGKFGVGVIDGETVGVLLGAALIIIAVAAVFGTVVVSVSIIIAILISI